MVIDGASFAGRVVLVTRVDNPLGSLLARSLAAREATLALACGTVDGDVSQLRRDLDTSGASALFVSGDLRDAEHAQGLIDEVQRRLGPPTDALLVVGLPRETAGLRVDAEIVFQASVLELFGVLRWLMPTLAPGGGVTLVFEAGDAMPAEQAAAVGAVAAMTRSLARSLATQRIRVNAVIGGDGDVSDDERASVARLVLAFADPTSKSTGEVVGASV